METMSHLISLGVGTNGPDSHAETYAEMTEFSKKLAANHDYVNLSSQLVGDDEDDENDGSDGNVEDAGCLREHLHHDENTLFKVRYALSRAGLNTQQVTDCVADMQNSGILFRERTPDESGDADGK